MASVNVVVFLAILLVLQAMTATSNFLSELSPLLPPALGLFLAYFLHILLHGDLLKLLMCFISLMGLRFCAFLSTGSIFIFCFVWLWIEILKNDITMILSCFSGAEDACEKVNCGRGKCKSSSNSSLLYHCECDPGWTQTTMDALNDTLKFLPCIVPNCELSLFFM